MPQSYLPQQADTRTFGGMCTRLLNDLNRPDLGDVVQDYLLDAIRYFQRQAFFFSECDNTEVPPWQAGTKYPFGSCVQVVNGDGYTDVMCAVSPGIRQSGPTPPFWPLDLYQPLPGSVYYEPPLLDEPGVVADGGVVWGNIGEYQPGFHTQLSTVPNANQYTPPVDYVAPYQVQLTTANLRLRLEHISFIELSDYDVIRPAPIAAYPRFWAYWQQQIYFWVYPSGFFPVTLNYFCGPHLVQKATDSNYWTTQGERLIRKYAQAAISREVLYDQEAAQLAMAAASEELGHLKAQAVGQQGYKIPAWDW